jgi:hypothetical protein
MYRSRPCRTQGEVEKAAMVLVDLQRQVGQEPEPMGKNALLNFYRLYRKQLKLPTDLIRCAALYVRDRGSVYVL